MANDTLSLLLPNVYSNIKFLSSRTIHCSVVICIFLLVSMGIWDKQEMEEE